MKKLRKVRSFFLTISIGSCFFKKKAHIKLSVDLKSCNNFKEYIYS